MDVFRYDCTRTCECVHACLSVVNTRVPCDPMTDTQQQQQQ